MVQMRAASFLAFGILVPLAGGRPAAAQSCPLAAPEVLVSGVADASHFAVDDKFFYFVGQTQTAVGVMRVDKGGGPPELVADERFLWPLARGKIDIATAAGNLYVLEPTVFNDNQSLGGGVRVFDPSGSEETQIRPSRPTLSPPSDCYTPVLNAMAVSPTGQVFTVQSLAIVTGPGSFPLGEICASSSTTFLGHAAPGDSTTTLVQRLDNGPLHLRADGSHIFWTDNDGLYRTPANGGPIDVLDHPSNRVSAIALAGDFIAWSGMCCGFTETYVVSAPGRRAQVTAPGNFTDLLFDGSYFYGNVPRTGAGGSLNQFRFKPNGNGLTNLRKAGGSSPSVLAVDDEFIYYVDPGGTNIMRACKSF